MDKELEIIKKTFAENEYLIKAIRALFFGLGVTDDEKKIIKSTFSDDELMTIMHRRFCPELDKNSPVGQVQDVWLGAEQMVFGASRDTIQQALEYKNDAIVMTKQALALLADPNGEAPIVSYNPKSYPLDTLGISLLSRNQYIRHIESQLNILYTIAGKKDETIAETKERINRNSSK